MGQRFKDHLQLIKAELVANDAGPWFLDELLSALDIYLAALFRWWQLYPTGEAGVPIDAQTLPNLFRLLSELAQRPAIAATCAEERIVLNLYSPVGTGGLAVHGSFDAL